MGLWAVFKLLGRLLSSLFKPRVSDHTSFQNSGMSENTTVALQDGISITSLHVTTQNQSESHQQGVLFQVPLLMVTKPGLLAPVLQPCCLQPRG